MTNYRRQQARIRRIEARFGITNRLMPCSGRDVEDAERAIYVRET